MFAGVRRRVSGFTVPASPAEEKKKKVRAKAQKTEAADESVKTIEGRKQVQLPAADTARETGT